jgi:Zn-dependent protease
MRGGRYLSRLMDTLILIPVLLMSFVVHEFAHAWVALKQGDRTALELGRVTLNPIPHIDLWGTILIPAMLIASGSGYLIGWAKPVPVVAANFHNPRRGDVLVSLAGVTANLLLAIACTLLMIGVTHLGRALPGSDWTRPVTRMLEAGISLNFLLLVFNLLPIPPLDGSRLVYHILPAGVGAVYRRYERYGMLVFLLLMVTGAFSIVLKPAGALVRLSFALIAWST